MNKLMGGVLLIVLSGAMLAHAEMRIWTSVKGDTVEAEYVNMFAGKVVLLRPDGKQLKVPIGGLSIKDRDYLASSIPPTIKIDVDVDKDRDTVSSYSSDYGSYNYERKAETIKCIAKIQQTNAETCSRDLTAHLYVIGEEVSRGTRRILSYAEHGFSFKDGKTTEFRSNPITVEYTKSDYSSNRGFKYEGYLVCVEDDAGQVIAVESSQSIYEKNLYKIKPARQNTEFDNDFDMINPPQNNNQKKKNNKNNN